VLVDSYLMQATMHISTYIV